MKINYTTALLVSALALLITFFLSSLASESTGMLLTLGSLLTLSPTLIGAVSISFSNARSTVLIRITSWIFFIVLLCCQTLFTLASTFQLQTYALVAGGLVVIYALIAYYLSVHTR
jgi:hypothetical protein